MSNSLRPMYCSPPDFSVHGIFQVRLLEWVAISYSRGYFWPRDQIHVSWVGRQILYLCATWQATISWLWGITLQWQQECRCLFQVLFPLPLDMYHKWGCWITWWSEVKWSEVTQSCPTLWDPMDCSPPGSSVHGIFQARILEWVAISFSRRSSWPRDRTWFSHIVGRRFTIRATREALGSYGSDS